MPALSEVLWKARVLVAGGWAPLCSRDAQGHFCTHDDEGLTTYSILDAVEVATCGATGSADLDVQWLFATAMRVLDRFVSPVKLGDWESAPGRTLADVLHLFARAHQHALAKEQRS